MSWNEGALSPDAAPLWRQIANRLRHSIATGEFKPGDVLPSETEIDAAFQVSRATARASLERLRHEGLISRQSGRGSIVLAPKVEQPVNELASFSEDMRRRGLTPSYSTFSAANERSSAEAAEALGLHDGADAFHIRRLLLADDEPIGMSESWLAPWVLVAGRAADAGGTRRRIFVRMAGEGLWAENRRRKRIHRGRSGRRGDGAPTRSRAGIGSPRRAPPLARRWTGVRSNTRRCITGPTGIASSSNSLEAALLNGRNDRSFRTQTARRTQSLTCCRQKPMRSNGSFECASRLWA